MRALPAPNFFMLHRFGFSNNFLGSRTFHHYYQLPLPWPSSSSPTSCSTAEFSASSFTLVSSSPRPPGHYWCPRPPTLPMFLGRHNEYRCDHNHRPVCCSYYPSLHGRLGHAHKCPESHNRRLWWSEFGDTLGGRDRASVEMHLETEIEWTQRCTWRPGSSECGDAFGDRDQVNSEMHLEAVIERVWRCTWRPWSSEIGRVLRGGRWMALRVIRLYSSVS